MSWDIGAKSSAAWVEITSISGFSRAPKALSMASKSGPNVIRHDYARMSVWWRPDCLAGHVRLELRDVVANYPFESSRGFPRSEPNSGHGDHSRLSCGLAETQLRSARILVASITRLLAALIAPTALWPAPACVHHGRAPHMSWGRRPRHQDKIHTLRISRRRSSSLFVQDSERARIAIDRHTECFRHAVGGNVAV